MSSPTTSGNLNNTQTPLETSSSNQFGTFGGVFTPSILTILGVIMFMRAGFVVGESGILGAIIILIIAKSITVLTALSVSAISTNMQVRGGGAYFMISRVLGAEFGGAIGLALFFAQALSVPFYILGFTEALVNSYEPLKPYFFTIAMISATALFFIAYVGAGWAIKAQYFIMGILVISIIVIFAGLIPKFSMETFQANWGAFYTPIDATNPEKGKYSFWVVFAIYFPAVTGILAGVNMSGDLKNPARSIPRGTLMSLGVAFVVYFSLAIVTGGAFERQILVDNPYQALKDNALFGMGFLVAAGVIAATLSSALGSYLGAPRILQAVARDAILGVVKPFAKGSVKGDEPRRALILTGIMTVIILIWAGNDSGGGPLNVLASIITMFFLYTYGMTNLAAFIEAFGSNPSFRPKFRFFHWITALLGTIGCVGVALLIDWVAAIVAALILGGLLWFITTRELETSFGDARRGYVYNSLRMNLLRLSNMEDDPKNWRPTILAFTGNPSSRLALVSYAVWLESGRGIVLLANVITGETDHVASRRRMAESQLKDFCSSNNIQAFPVIAVDPDIKRSISILLQTTSIGPIRPNIAMFGWTNTHDQFHHLAQSLRTANTVGMGLVLIRDKGVPTFKTRKRIDIWWRGNKNGELMILLAHLLTRNWEWAGSQLRVRRVVYDEAGVEPATQALQALIDEARVDALAEAVLSDGRPFTQIIKENSWNAHCVFLGFEVPEEGDENRWHGFYEEVMEFLPTTILVSALGTENMRA